LRKTWKRKKRRRDFMQLCCGKCWPERGAW
jgi:hypothetical protein